MSSVEQAAQQDVVTEDNNTTSSGAEDSTIEGGSFIVGGHAAGAEVCSLFNAYAAAVVEQEAQAATQHDSI